MLHYFYIYLFVYSTTSCSSWGESQGCQQRTQPSLQSDTVCACETGLHCHHVTVLPLDRPLTKDGLNLSRTTTFGPELFKCKHTGGISADIRFEPDKRAELWSVTCEEERFMLVLLCLVKTKSFHTCIWSTDATQKPFFSCRWKQKNVQHLFFSYSLHFLFFASNI